jgi:uncharacterized protein (UPF0335 family)
MAKKPKRELDVDDDPQFQTTREGANSVLRMHLERALRLEEEKKGIADDIKDIFTELKASGYDGKMSRRMMAEMKMKPEDREEMLMLEQTYRDEVF